MKTGNNLSAKEQTLIRAETAEAKRTGKRFATVEELMEDLEN